MQLLKFTATDSYVNSKSISRIVVVNLRVGGGLEYAIDLPIQLTEVCHRAENSG